MSGKLDQTLGDIISTQRRTAGRRRSTRRPGDRPAVAAPVGGIQKTTKPARNAAAKPGAPAKKAAATGESKIIVSNLPKDVSEAQIKEYFVNSVGPIKRVELTYGPNGQSRGIANITFVRADGATTASSKLNGLLVDGKPIKIEVVVGAALAADLIPPAKSLTERISQPKSQPKSAAAEKKTDGVAKTGVAGTRGGRGGNRGRRGGRSARPAKKTAEELDSEMADYFNENNAAAEAAAPAATGAANGDAAMDDGIL